MTIVKLFEEQVAKTPEAIAIRYKQSDLTYDQLNRRANQLAHHIRNMGVGSEQTVGLFIERSPEMVVGILGVLKAGGAYVPLDPEYPAERLAFMLEDSQVPILITQAHLKRKLSTITNPYSKSADLKVIYLDSDWDEIGQRNFRNPSEGAKAEALAYIMYTSGSTGQPKGVMIEHRNIFNRLVWMRDALPLTENDRVLHKSPFSFDASIWEIFWTLLSGARLIIAKPGGHKDSDYLISMIVKEEITAIHFVPSLLQVFLLNNDVDRCQSLKRVICGGEVLPYDLMKRLLSRLDVELYNQYGPTEVAIGVTCWLVEEENEFAIVPIGRPIPNTTIHLLDTELQPVPYGEPGEIHIGGVQVARGYLNRPELTSERFIPDPFSTDQTAHLYKTGDLAQYLPDGTISFLGRIDHQVKIRGNRVELGEIEATLVQHPGIREAVVIAHEFSPGDKRLFAYIVPDQERPLNISELRDFLSAKLPDYMVPASFSILDRLPLVSSGKVDHQALPAPKQVRPDLDESYVAPRNSTEEYLAKIWAQVIGLDQVGIHDNFLELGGDSIMSIQIIARAHQYGLHVTSNQVLEHQTIAKLASLAKTVPIVRAEQEPVTGSLPLTPAQKWFFELNLQKPNLWSQSLLLEVAHPLNASTLEKAVQQLLIHHDALRLRFTQNKAVWQAMIDLPDEIVPFSSVDLSGLAVDHQRAAVRSSLAELQASINLSEGPLLRVALIELGRDVASYLLIVVHHLAVDGASWRILLEDLDLLYQQISQGVSVQLPPKTTSYKHWAQQLIEYAQSDRLKREVPYWLELKEMQIGRLPKDDSVGRGRPGESSNDPVSVSLGIEDTRSLLTEVPKAYRTLITDVLLTAFAEAITKWTGESEIKVDIEGHGRVMIYEDLDLSHTAGCFITIYPIRLYVEGSMDPGKKLISVKEQLRQIPSSGIGYGIIRYLSREEQVIQKLQAQPQSEVRFHHMGQLDHLTGEASIFKQPQIFRGPKRNQPGGQPYLLEVTSGIVQGQLQIHWAYRKNSYQRATIKKLASDFLNLLKILIAHCKSPMVGHYTPSDFPEANLSQQELDDLLAEIGEG